MVVSLANHVRREGYSKYEKESSEEEQKNLFNFKLLKTLFPVHE